MRSFEFGAHAFGFDFIHGADTHAVDRAATLIALADLGI